MAGNWRESRLILLAIYLHFSFILVHDTFKINKSNVQSVFYNKQHLFKAKTVASSEAVVEVTNLGTSPLRVTGQGDANKIQGFLALLMLILNLILTIPQILCITEVVNY